MNIETRPSKKDWKIIGGFALSKILLHGISNLFFAYGYFRDELYYIACSEHLATGYVDHPPLSIYLLKISRVLFGDSIFALRLFPSFFGALTIVLTGLLTKKLGGNSFAVFLSCLASFCSLIIIAMNSYYSMNSIDILIWVAAAYLIVRIIQEQHTRLWILLGVVLGLGLLNKIGILFLGCGIFVGLLLTTERVWLKSKSPYLCALIAFILFFPYILWNVNNDFSHLEFIKNASQDKYSSLNSIKFLTDQFLINNPLNFPLWVLGLFGLLFYKPLRPYRIIGFIYLTTLCILDCRGSWGR